MKNISGFMLLVLAVLVCFGCWQWNDARQKGQMLAAQGDIIAAQKDSIDILEKRMEELAWQAKKIDTALAAWREENDAIDLTRQGRRAATKKAAKKDTTLRQQLAEPLHPALHAGGGLLGKTAGAACSGGGANDPGGAAQTCTRP